MARRRKFVYSSRVAQLVSLRRQRETPEETRIRREKGRIANAARRARETPEEKEIRKQAERRMAARRRACIKERQRRENKSRLTRQKRVRYICREESPHHVSDRGKVCNRVVCKYGLRKITKGKKECEDCERDVDIHHVRGQKHRSRDHLRTKIHEHAQDQSRIRDPK